MHKDESHVPPSCESAILKHTSSLKGAATACLMRSSAGVLIWSNRTSDASIGGKRTC